ncbi:MAG: MarC family protein [Flavobacteriales bacterium]
MSFNWTEIFKASMVLFAVIDIIGSIPVILDIKKRAGDIHPGRASLVALGIMLLFFFIGEDLIGLFGIGIEEFAVAGAFVLFFLALEMILGIDLFKQDDKSLKSATIVPVAFPLIAGAGTMTSIISLQAEYQPENILVAIVVNIVVVFTVLKLTKRIENVLGEGGVAVLKKVFGVILLAIAVKLFSTNLPLLLD